MRPHGIDVDWAVLNEDWRNPLLRVHRYAGAIDPWRAVGAAFRQRHYDFYFCIQQRAAYVLALLAAAGLVRRPIILIDPIKDAYWAGEMFLETCLRRCSAILTLGRSQSELMRALGAKGDIVFVGHATDTSFFRPQPSVIPAAERYIFCPGNDGGRDFGALFEALGGISRRAVIKTTLAVEPPPALRDRVRIIRERLDFPAFRQLYVDAAVVALPLFDRQACGGITVLGEAIAMSRPVVASRTTHLAEHLDAAGLEGVPPGDPRAFAAALEEALAERADAPDKLAAGRRNAVESRDSHVVMGRVAHAIRAVVESRRSGAGGCMEIA